MNSLNQNTLSQNTLELNQVMNTFNKKLILSGVILISAASSSFVQAAPFGLEARSLGMGNVSVATADIATAALSNPAMLSYQDASDDFSLLISGGFLIDDSDGMVDAIDAFQLSLNQLIIDQAVVLTGVPATDAPLVNAQITSVNSMTASGNALGGKVLSPTGDLVAVIGFSFEEYSLAFSVRNDVVVATGLTAVNFGTAITLLDPLTANTTDVTNAVDAVIALEAVINTSGNNIFSTNGASITEFGLSGAKSFELFGQKVSIGITPKLISAESFSSSIPIAGFDTGVSSLIDTLNTGSLGETFTVDVGLVSQLSENTQVGLVIKNLIEDTLVNGPVSVNIGRQVRVGVAYRDDFFTIGADLDLLEIDPVVVSAGLQSKATQMISVGAEFNAWDVVQVRVGMQKNIADNVSPTSEDALLTAGVGFWVGINVDVAVIATGDTIGGIVQTGLKF